MENGYGNCYPKNSGGNGFGFRPTGNSSGVDGGPIIHSAVAHLPVINSSCDDGKVVATDNGTGYTLSCSQNRPGNDLTQYHTTNLTDCITTCEQYSLGKCIGVVLDTNMKNGYQNCYLKSGIGTPMTQQGYILALQGGTVTSSNSTNTTSPTSTPSNSGSGGSSSKGWIAGPVVGGVAAIALLGAAIWFFRRRKQRSATAGAVEKDGQSVPSSSTGHGQPPAYGSGADPKYRYSSPGTPGGAGWEGAPASTPMAEMGGQDRHEMPTQKDQQPVELPAQSHNVL